MRKNSLGNRMKEYERISDFRLVRRLPMVVRLDGKAFHSWTKKTGCVRPFDYRQKVEVDGRQGPVNRQKFLVDRDIPIFASSESAGWWSRFLK